MVKHRFTFLCKKAITDSVTNNLSIIDIIENISVELEGGVPKDSVVNVHFPMEIVTVFGRSDVKNSDEKIIFTLGLILPGEKKPRSSYEVVFSFNGRKNVRQIISIPEIVVNGSGLYAFEIKYKSEIGSRFKLASRTEFYVQITENSKN